MKEIIERKLILTKLKIVSEEKENGAYICDKEHSKLLLSYIEQLEKQAELADHYKHLYSEVKKQKDDVVELINYYGITPEQNDNVILRHILKDILRMLGEEDEIRYNN